MAHDQLDAGGGPADLGGNQCPGCVSVKELIVASAIGPTMGRQADSTPGCDS
jgi:hypothetical protein